MIIVRLVIFAITVQTLTKEETYKATSNLYNLLTEISADAVRQGKLIDISKISNGSKMKEEKVEEQPRGILM